MRRAMIVAAVLGMMVAVSGTRGEPAPQLDPTRVLRLASTPWSPFTNSEAPRFANDLVHEALERNGILEQTTIVEEGRLTAALEEGKYDGSAALWRSPERERYLLYSDPYLENRLMLVGRKGADLSAESLSDLAGRKVALVATHAYGEAVEEAAGPEFVLGPSPEANLRRLLGGEVDYMLVDAVVTRYILDHHAEESLARLEIGKNTLVKRTLHFAVRRDVPGASHVIDVFNSEIRGMLADGTYNRILNLSWIRADVDGDGVADVILRGDYAGDQPPEEGYEVLTVEVSPATKGETSGERKPRIVVGGKAYPDWATVPQQYKVWDQAELERQRSQATFFRFEF